GGVLNIITGLIFLVSLASPGGWLLAPVGIIAIVGGIFAIKRRFWGFALVGAICASVFFLGVPAIILIVLSKAEFTRKPQSTVRASTTPQQIVRPLRATPSGSGSKDVQTPVDNRVTKITRSSKMGSDGTALITAVTEGDPKIVETLLTKGADVNAKDKDGWTALFAAAYKGDPKTVEMLLTKGADVNAKDEEGLTALILAAQGGHTKIVEMLITKGADVNAKDKEGGFALMFALHGGHTEIVRLLKQGGAKE
ncbi:ankyrin repeat domain-containing protein, partial [Chloroflexota bacterium]